VEEERVPVTKKVFIKIGKKLLTISHLRQRTYYICILYFSFILKSLYFENIVSQVGK